MEQRGFHAHILEINHHVDVSCGSMLKLECVRGGDKIVEGLSCELELESSWPNRRPIHSQMTISFL